MWNPFYCIEKNKVVYLIRKKTKSIILLKSRISLSHYTPGHQFDTRFVYQVLTLHNSWLRVSRVKEYFELIFKICTFQKFWPVLTFMGSEFFLYLTPFPHRSFLMLTHLAEFSSLKIPCSRRPFLQLCTLNSIIFLVCRIRYKKYEGYTIFRY